MGVESEGGSVNGLGALTGAEGHPRQRRTDGQVAKEQDRTGAVNKSRN